MKNLKNISVVILFLAFVTVNAAELEKEGISLSGNQNLVVELPKVGQGTSVSFEDLQGGVLFKDNLLTDGNYSKTLNLEMIPQGAYVLKVEKKFATRIWKIFKTSEGIELSADASVVSFKPQFRLQDKFVKVFMTNPSGSRVDLIVEDKRGEVLANLRDSNDVFTKTLDFSNLPSGEYYLTVLKNKEKYIEKVVIN